MAYNFMSGTLNLSGELYVSDRIGRLNDADTYIDLSVEDEITFYVGNKKLLTLDEDSTDEVVVGNASENTNFRVATNGYGNNFIVKSTNGSGVDNAVGIREQSPQAVLHVSGTHEDLFLLEGNGGNILSVTGSGLVGIGTSLPEAVLHISSSVPDFWDGDIFRITDSSPSGGRLDNPLTTAEMTSIMMKVSGSGITFGNQQTWFDFGVAQIGAQDTGYGRIELGTGSSTTGNMTRLIYNADGAVGGDGTFQIWDILAGVHEQVFELDGTALEIFGTAGKPGGGSWDNSTSDRRLKENIVNLTGSLAKIQQLQGRAYEWKKPECHNGVAATAGFIAQEMQEVFPEFVREAKLPCGEEESLIPDGTALTYGLPDAFMAHLVEAVKEQQLIIESLEARIQQLEDE